MIQSAIKKPSRTPQEPKVRRVYNDDIARYGTTKGRPRRARPDTRRIAHNDECRRRIWTAIVEDAEKGNQWAIKKVDVDRQGQAIIDERIVRMEEDRDEGIREEQRRHRGSVDLPGTSSSSSGPRTASGEPAFPSPALPDDAEARRKRQRDGADDEARPSPTGRQRTYGPPLSGRTRERATNILMSHPQSDHRLTLWKPGKMRPFVGPSRVYHPVLTRQVGVTGDMTTTTKGGPPSRNLQRTTRTRQTSVMCIALEHWQRGRKFQIDAAKCLRHNSR